MKTANSPAAAPYAHEPAGMSEIDAEYEAFLDRNGARWLAMLATPGEESRFVAAVGGPNDPPPPADAGQNVESAADDAQLRATDATISAQDIADIRGRLGAELQVMEPDGRIFREFIRVNASSERGRVYAFAGEWLISRVGDGLALVDRATLRPSGARVVGVSL